MWSNVTSPSPPCARLPSAPAPSASSCCSTRGAGAPTLIELTAAGLEIVAQGQPAPEPGAAQPAPLPEIRRPPASALAVDTEQGELEAPIGVVVHLAEVVLALARAAGGRSVATVDFATRDPELPLTIAAREGEPIVLAIGDRQFLLPEGVG